MAARNKRPIPTAINGTCECAISAWLCRPCGINTTYTCRGCGKRTLVSPQGEIINPKRSPQGCPDCYSRLTYSGSRPDLGCSYWQCSYCEKKWMREGGQLKPAKEWPQKLGRTFHRSPNVDKEQKRAEAEEKQRARLLVKKEKALARQKANQEKP